MFVLAVYRMSFRYRWSFGFLAAITLFGLGFGRAVQWEGRARPVSVPEEGSYRLVLASRPEQGERWMKVVGRVTHFLEGPGRYRPVSFRAMLYLEPKDSLTVPEYGAELFVHGSFFRVQAARNPEAFDFRSYLRSRNIHFQAFFRADDWEVGGKAGASLSGIFLAWQETLLQILRESVPGEAECGLISALVLGYRNDLSPEIKAAYAETGAIHVLAVSGLHVGLIYLILDFFLRRIGFSDRRRPWMKAGMLLSGIWCFALITGGAPSVLRAATMFSFVIAGKAINRHGSIFNTLAASAFFLLWLQPYMLFQPGFQLSYLAVIGIVFFQHRIYRLWIPGNALLDQLWKLTSVSLAAQLTTSPISLYYFHQFPVYFWLSGLIVVPAASVILSSCLLLLACSLISTAGAGLIGNLLSFAVRQMNALIFRIEALPGSLIRGLWLDEIELLGLYGVLLLFMLGLFGKKARLLLWALALLLALTVKRSVKIWQAYQQKELVVYAAGREFLMDVFWGKSAYSVQSEGLTEKQLAFTAANYRLSRGIKEVIAIPDTCRRFQGPGFAWQEGYFLFNNKFGMVWSAGAFPPPPNPADSLNWLILSGIPGMNAGEVLAKYPSRQLILAENSSRKKEEQWLKELEKKEIAFHQLRKEGCWRHRTQ
jgi:competence protein ComEC